MSTPRQPKDLPFNFFNTNLTLSVWPIAYDKGASAGIRVKTKMEIGEMRPDYDDNQRGTKITIEHEELQYGLKYADLVAISKWASKAASWLKYQETKGKYSRSFNEKETLNGEQEKFQAVRAKEKQVT